MSDSDFAANGAQVKEQWKTAVKEMEGDLTGMIKAATTVESTL